ncbi:peptidoglycan recognition protein family protein [Staphylococcus pettenkoferi]|uniref:peptidoglycan recognition protein family protein n=1 Tax=Staphylococcus pettenkoferi TaxID=170573 RepID=UPI00398C459B
MVNDVWNGVPVEYQYLPLGTRRYGEKLATNGHKPVFLVAHDTGNPNTSAQDNVNYYRNTYNVDWDHVASAHIFVDDKKAIVCVPLDEKAWHVLYNAQTDNTWYHIDANDGSVGTEISYFSDRKRSIKSLDNGARVLAYLAKKFKINYKTHMPGHQDIQADKQDPGNLLAACGYSRGTANLDKIVAHYMGANATTHTSAIKSEHKPVKKTEWNWKGTFYPNAHEGLRVRLAPSLNGSIVDKGSWLYTKDDWVKFDRIIKANGYWWIRFKYQQKGSSKNHFYCAVCKITDPKQRIKHEKYFGTIKWQ